MILIRPIATEKTVKLIEKENKIVFEVDLRASKPEIAKEVARRFNVKVDKVNTMIRGNKKYAFIKLRPESSALDLATKLGIA